MEKTTKEEFEDRLAQIVARGADVTADAWMKEIEVEYGRVPLIFKRMGERPEVLISHLLYKGTVAQTSPLDPKYVELISLAVGVLHSNVHTVPDITCRLHSKWVRAGKRFWK